MKMRTNDIGGAFNELCRLLGVPALIAVLVILRGWWQGRRRWKARFIEGGIFGLISSVVVPVAQYEFEQVLGMPEQVAYKAAILVCMALGYVGADTLGEWLKSWGDKKAGGE